MPKAFTLTGTAKNLAPFSGSAVNPHKCSNGSGSDLALVERPLMDVVVPLQTVAGGQADRAAFAGLGAKSLFFVKERVRARVEPQQLVRPPRFERGTPCLEGRCSIQLSYGRNLVPKHLQHFPSPSDSDLIL